MISHVASIGARATLVALFVGLIFIMTPERGSACSCGPIGSPSMEFRRATAVFAGTLVGSTTVGEERRWVFDVTTVWKGPADRRLSVNTTATPRGAPCPSPTFRRSAEYLVYAYDGWTGICSRTRELWSAEADLRELGTGRAPTIWRTPSATVSAYLAVIVAMPLIVGAAWVGLRTGRLSGWRSARNQRTDFRDRTP